MTEWRALPATVSVPPELIRQLEKYNIEPIVGSEFMVFGLFVVFKELERKQEMRKPGLEYAPEWMPLFMYLRTLFEVVTAMEEQRGDQQEEKSIKEPKPEPSKEPLYTDMTPFQGKPITGPKNPGPYMLPKGSFGALRRQLFGPTEKPLAIMADSLAQMSEVELLRVPQMGEIGLGYVKELLQRIYEEYQGPADGSEFLVEVPSLYYGVVVSAKMWPSITIAALCKAYGSEIVSRQGEIDMYRLARLSELELQTLEIGWLRTAMLRNELTHHANDIYLKK